MRHVWIVLLASLLITQPTLAGPIFLSGDDSDEHFPDFSPCSDSLILPIFQNVLDNVTNGGSGILALGVNSPSTFDAGKFVSNVAGCLDPVQTVTFSSGTNINTVSFGGYAILWVPSNNADTQGGIVQADNTRVVNRKSDIQTFVNGGGGLIILTQGTLTNAWDMVVGECGEDGSVTTLGTLDNTGIFLDCVNCNPCVNDPIQDVECFWNVSATATGQALGLTDTNYDHCCFHTVFTAYPSFYSPLTLCDTSQNNPGVGVDYNGQAQAIGGVTVGICGSDDWGWTHRP